jgi:hypothetical protein
MVSSAYGMCCGMTDEDPGLTVENSPVWLWVGDGERSSDTGGQAGGAAGEGIEGGDDTGMADTGTAEIGVWDAGGGVSSRS